MIQLALVWDTEKKESNIRFVGADKESSLNNNLYKDKKNTRCPKKPQKAAVANPNRKKEEKRPKVSEKGLNKIWIFSDGRKPGRTDTICR